MSTARSAEDKQRIDGCGEDSDRVSRRQRGGDRGTENEQKGACLGITPLLSSHNTNLESIKETAVVAIDWLETAGVIEWDTSEESELRDEVCRLYTTAAEMNHEEPIVLNGMQCLIQPTGLGRGRQSRMTYRITCGKTTLAFSLRENATRQNSNLVITIPGESCLLYGGLVMRDWAHQVIEDLGGVVDDEWVRRIDVCVDLPGVDASELLLPLCNVGQYISTVTKGATHFDKTGLTGFTIGSRDRLQLQIYNKLREAMTKNDAAYFEAMLQKRWKDLPKCATRVELRIGRGWICQWNQDRADDVIDNLGSLVRHILLNERRVFFKLLAEMPDRKNKHQSRCEILPLWSEISQVLVQDSGKDGLELTKIERGQISLGRAYKCIRSMLSKAAAIRGETISGLGDAIKQLQSLEQLNDGTDEQWREVWLKKQREIGLPVEAEEFPFGKNSSAGSEETDLAW